MKTSLFLAIGLMITTQSAVARTDASDEKLLEALIKVESCGNDRAIGDQHMREKAYGPLQIRKPCVDDVNRRFGTKHRPEDMLGNRTLSKWVCQNYIKMYATKKLIGKEPSLEDMARIWNGGPSGWKKKSTEIYWSKVQKALQSQNQLASR